MSREWDVFISHASEDKEEIARPLAEALRLAGVRVWYDDFTLTLGDSLNQSISRGLAGSRYGIVILSPNFFAKQWPQVELNGLVAREAASGKAILPIWHHVDRAAVLEYSPVLADKLAVSTDKGLEVVVREIMEALALPGAAPGPSLELRKDTKGQSPSPRRSRNWLPASGIAALLGVIGFAVSALWNSPPSQPSLSLRGVLSGDVPQFAFDGGGILVLVLVAWFMIQIVYESVRNTLASGLEEYFKKEPVRLVCVGLFMALVLYSVTTSHYATLGLGTAVLGPIALWRSWPVGMLARGLRVTALGASVAAGEVTSEWLEAPPIPVYVSLAFQPQNNEDKEMLRRISTMFRDTLETCFAGVRKLEIRPTSFEGDAPDVWTKARHRDAIRALAVSPQLVLANTANVWVADKDNGLILLTEAHLPIGGGPLTPIGRPIREIGTESEIRYLSLRAAWGLVKTLRSQQAIRLTADEELEVKRRILRSFRDFVLGQEVIEVDTARIDALVAAEGIGDVELDELLESYERGRVLPTPTAITKRQAAVKSKVRGWLR